MNGVSTGRYVADLEGDFVVFLIGMRINKPWKLHRWLPVYRAMGRMLAELERLPDKGLLGWERALIGGPAVVQYWRSFAHLERFARDPGDLHVPAWREWNRTVRDSDDVGIWHETYRIRTGEYEAIYGNMPRFGLAAAGDHLPIRRKGLSAARRLGLRDDDALTVPDPAYASEAEGVAR
jgi:hypothetical protein